MNVDFNKITSIIKEQMKHYEDRLERGDIGVVTSVGDGICLVDGLDNVMSLELLNFPNDVQGMALNLEENYVGVVIFGNDYAIKDGDIVKRTGKIVEVPVGNAMLGRVVNALGKPIDGKGPINTTKFRPIERIASGVMARESVNQPLQTGIKAIDAMIPIGKGQRELIIGDRQTGKTTIAIDTIINQKGKDVYCIYVAIGQKNSTVIQIANILKEHHALSYTTIVNASAGELSPLQYIAPYAGCAIGEEWMENGKDVLIVYDDLSKHAVAYRTMSLLLRRPPGREAYPGDVFYLHSRLLERSANLNKEHGGGSLTALPIIETQSGDISAYIPTNVISITDGQIFLKADLFNSGFRPALDTGLSVSRVGSAAQLKAMKQVTGNLKIELAQFNELQSFTQFGSDLDEATKKILNHGEKVQELLKQGQYSPLSAIDQVITFFAVRNGFVDMIDKSDLSIYEKELHEFMQIQYDSFYQELSEDPVLDKAREKKLKKAIEEFTDTFKRTHGS